MLIYISSIILGLILLVWSADKFIEGGSSVASHLNVQPLLIGILILGFGTSAPEIIVAIFASLAGKPTLALGNALGSNITNIALVLGISTIFVSIKIQASTLKLEFPLLIISMIITGILMIDGELSLIDSAILIGMLIIVLSWIIHKGKQQQSSINLEIPNMSLKTAWFWTITGLVLLIVSSKILIYGSTNIALQFGLSELVIGLTIVAIGTSLPELAATLSAALKGKHEMAIGNIIGSNLFNLLGVIGISGIIKPYAVSDIAMSRDFLIMLLLTVFLFAIAFTGNSIVKRHHGIILLLCFCSYMGLIYTHTLSN